MEFRKLVIAQAPLSHHPGNTPIVVFQRGQHPLPFRLFSGNTSQWRLLGLVQ